MLSFGQVITANKLSDLEKIILIVVSIELQSVIQSLQIKSFDTYPQVCQAHECQIRRDKSLLYRQKGYFTVDGSRQVFHNFEE